MVKSTQAGHILNYLLMDEIQKTVQLLNVALSFNFPGERLEDSHHQHHHHQHQHVLLWLNWATLGQ